jgi:hypothetical protein
MGDFLGHRRVWSSSTCALEGYEYVRVQQFFYNIVRGVLDCTVSMREGAPLSARVIVCWVTYTLSDGPCRVPMCNTSTAVFQNHPTHSPVYTLKRIGVGTYKREPL